MTKLMTKNAIQKSKRNITQVKKKIINKDMIGKNKRKVLSRLAIFQNV